MKYSPVDIFLELDFEFSPYICCPAQVAKLVDALPSGGSAGNGVMVRIHSWAQKEERRNRAESDVYSALLFPSLPLSYSL
jgi:hypothetical protein